MKKIVINGLGISDYNVYGVQRNTIELLKELDKLIGKNIVQLLMPYNAERKYNFKNIEVVYKHLPKIRGSKKLWYMWIFPWYVRKNKYVGADFTLGLPIWGCDISVLYDCITEKYKENAKTIKEKLSRLSYIYRARLNTRRNKVIFTDSEFAKKELSDYYGIKEDKIKVLYCGWQHFNDIEADDSIIRKLNLQNKRFIFALGSRYKHKNTKWIIEAAKQNPEYFFVVSGSNTLNSSESEYLNHKINNLMFTGYLLDGEIKALMKKCVYFVQPSLCEGFGIPPMEAMSVGAKCIVSNRASLPEVYGSSVWYINPDVYSGIDINSIVQTKVDDNDYVLNKFSWKNSAELLKEYFCQLVRN